MTTIRAVALTVTFAGMLAMLGLTQMAGYAEAARPSQKQLLSICRAKYGSDITSASIRKNGQIVCQEGPGTQATRKAVYEWCKKKFNATTIVMQKRGNRWQCLYYGRY